MKKANWTTLIRNRYTGGMAAMMLIAAPLTASFEGNHLKAYLDPVGIPTIGYGETAGVKMGDVITQEAAELMLITKLGMYGHVVDFVIKPEMSPETHAALTSFAYNVGLEAFRKSTLVRLYNANNKKAACNQLPRWGKAKGRVLKGLVIRREKERQLCLQKLR